MRAPCGTVSRYNAGCRCGSCRGAMSGYQRGRYARSRPSHGLLPTELLLEALDDRCGHKTAEHFLWLRVYNLIRRHRALMGRPNRPGPPLPPAFT